LAPPVNGGAGSARVLAGRSAPAEERAKKEGTGGGVAYDLLEDLTKQYLNPDVSPDDWDVENYKLQIKTIYDFDADAEQLDIPNYTSAEVVTEVGKAEGQVCAKRNSRLGRKPMRTYERIIMLNIIDAQ